MATAGKRKIPLPEKRCRITSPREKRKKRKTNKKMEGHCKERHVVEEAEGGRRDRPEQGATNRTRQTDHVGDNGDRRRRCLVQYHALYHGVPVMGISPSLNDEI